MAESDFAGGKILRAQVISGRGDAVIAAEPAGLGAEREFALRTVIAFPSVEFFQFIDAGCTPANVGQYGRRPRTWRGRQFLEGGGSGTVDALGIGMIPMHNPVEDIQ